MNLWLELDNWRTVAQLARARDAGTGGGAGGAAAPIALYREGQEGRRWPCD